MITINVELKNLKKALAKFKVQSNKLANFAEDRKSHAGIGLEVLPNGSLQLHAYHYKTRLITVQLVEGFIVDRDQPRESFDVVYLAAFKAIVDSLKANKSRETTEDFVSLEFMTDCLLIHHTHDNNHELHTLPYMTAPAFKPYVPPTQGRALMTVGSKELAEGLEALKSFVAKTDNKPILQYIKIEESRMVATDGFMMGVYHLHTPEYDAPLALSLPDSQILVELGPFAPHLAHMKKHNENVTIRLSADGFVFECPGLPLIEVTDCEYKFPDYARVYTSALDNQRYATIKISRGKSASTYGTGLLGAIGQISAFDKDAYIDMEIESPTQSPAGLVLSYSDYQGDICVYNNAVGFVEIMPDVAPIADMPGAFSANVSLSKLRHIVSACNTDMIEFSIVNTIHSLQTCDSIIIRSGQLEVLLMPARSGGEKQWQPAPAPAPVAIQPEPTPAPAPVAIEEQPAPAPPPARGPIMQEIKTEMAKKSAARKAAPSGPSMLYYPAPLQVVSFEGQALSQYYPDPFIQIDLALDSIELEFVELEYDGSSLAVGDTIKSLVYSSDEMPDHLVTRIVVTDYGPLARNAGGDTCMETELYIETIQEGKPNRLPWGRYAYAALRGLCAAYPPETTQPDQPTQPEEQETMTDQLQPAPAPAKPAKVQPEVTLDITESAKIAKRVLVAAFPGVKFSVRKTAGYSVRVEWTDGPTTKQVKATLEPIRAGHNLNRDSMTDYAGYVTKTPVLFEGKLTQFTYGGYDGLPSFVRNIAKATQEAVKIEVATSMGWSPDEIDPSGPNWHDYRHVWHAIHKAIDERDFTPARAVAPVAPSGNPQPSQPAESAGAVSWVLFKKGNAPGWFWFSGDTKPIKDQLKAHGCRWSSKRNQWYFMTTSDAPDVLPPALVEFLQGGQPSQPVPTGKPAPAESGASGTGYNHGAATHVDVSVMVCDKCGKRLGTAQERLQSPNKYGEVWKLNANTFCEPCYMRLTSEEKTAIHAAPLPVASKIAHALAVKFRRSADSLTAQIDKALAPRLENTYKRARQAEYTRQNGWNMQALQSALRCLADGWDNDSLTPLQRKITTKKQLELILYHYRMFAHPYHNPQEDGRIDPVQDMETIERNWGYQVREGALFACASFSEYWQLVLEVADMAKGGSSYDSKAASIASKVQALALTKTESYFPTPSDLVKRMLHEADIQPNDTILEPSAGAGHIADIIRSEYPDNTLQCVEVWGRAVEVLQLKGHAVEQADFLQYEQGGWNKIIMNPPLNNLADIDHVLHAYSLLSPGGRIVAIMGAGFTFRQDKKATNFRQWLETVGAYADLPADTFKASDRPTGVKTCLVVIDKPKQQKEQKTMTDPQPAPIEILGRVYQADQETTALLLDMMQQATDTYNLELARLVMSLCEVAEDTGRAKRLK